MSEWEIDYIFEMINYYLFTLFVNFLIVNLKLQLIYIFLLCKKLTHSVLKYHVLFRAGKKSRGRNMSLIGQNGRRRPSLRRIFGSIMLFAEKVTQLISR